MDTTNDPQAQVFQQLRAAGENLQAGLWRPADLDTLQAIAGDVVALNSKADLALKGRPGFFPPIRPRAIDPVTVATEKPPTPVIAKVPPVIATRPLLMNAVALRPLAEAAPDHAAQIAQVAPTLNINQLYVIAAIPPDPARAAMYRAAAARAVDSAANLALVRIQATAPDVAKDQFVSQVWSGLSALLPALTTSATAPASTPAAPTS